MSLWLSVALAGRWLVGVEVGATDLDVDGDGLVDGTTAPLRCFRSSRVCVVDGLDEGTVLQRDGVRYVEPDRPAQRLQGTALAPCPPTDPADEEGYELGMAGVTSGTAGGAWAEGRGAGAVVAVQDAGFRTSHEDLAGRIVRGWDYGDDDARPEVSPAGVPEHGTFVAGIVAANEDGSGRVGVAPEAELFVQKIADGTGALFFSYAIEAMDDLVQTAPEVKVVDYSIASLDPPRAFEDAVAGLGVADVLLVTAAANCPAPNCDAADNDANPVYPANYALTMDHVLAVASQRPDGTLDPFSHYGASSVAVGAPGADVCSLGVTSDSAYVRASGTSYAAPLVAGVAALVRQAFPRLSAGETEALLCATSDATAPLAGRVRCGAVDADRALHAAWPGALGGDGLDASVGLVVGEGVSVVVSVDNRAGAEDVVVSLEGDGFAAEPVTVTLPADGVSTVELVVEASVEGPLGGELVVAGCCAEARAAFAGDAVLPTGDTAHTGTDPLPEATGATGGTDDTGAAAPSTRAAPSEVDAKGCGCTQSEPVRAWPWLSRLRAPPAPAPAAAPDGR